MRCWGAGTYGHKSAAFAYSVENICSDIQCFYSQISVQLENHGLSYTDPGDSKFAAAHNTAGCR